MRWAPLVMAAALSAALAPSAHADGARGSARHSRAQAPIDIVAAANAAARQRPERDGFQEARHVYAFQPGAIYEFYTNPSYVSTILLEPGESLSNIAAGDTSRWMVTQAEAATDGERRIIVLVKPQAANLRTNIVLITDRRTYLVEASSQSGRIYSAQIAWSYPGPGEPGGLQLSNADLHFNYRVHTVRGRTPIWQPSRVFDDGRRTWIEFSQGVAASDMAPLFVITPDGAELVNYRVQNTMSGQRYMVDRIFDRAELRLGTHAQTIVRIERRHASRTSSQSGAR